MGSLWKKGFSFSIAFHVMLASVFGLFLAYGYVEPPPKNETFFEVVIDEPEGGSGQPEESSGSEGVNNQQLFTLPNVMQQSAVDKDDVVDQPKEHKLSNQNTKPNSNNSKSTNTQRNSGKTSNSSNSTGGSSSAENNSKGSGGEGGSNGIGKGGASDSDKAAAIERFVRMVENNKGSYPYMALKQNKQGVTYVYVKLDALGSVVSHYVATSSGDKGLDDASLKAVKKSCPFSHGLGEELTMNVPVRWTIN